MEGGVVTKKPTTPGTHERLCYTHNTTPNTNAPAHARAHSRLIPRVKAHEPRCYTRHATRTAPAALGPLRATRRLFPDAWPHKPLPPPAVASPHARRALFVSRVPTLFSAGQFFILLLRHVAPHPLASTHAPAAHCATLHCLVPGSHPLFGRPFSRTHTHAHSRAHARTRTSDDERRDVRSAGVADWITVRRGNTERTLTA